MTPQVTRPFGQPDIFYREKKLDSLEKIEEVITQLQEKEKELRAQREATQLELDRVRLDLYNLITVFRSHCPHVEGRYLGRCKRCGEPQ